MKIHKVKQLSEEWFELRKGKLTASHAQEIGNNGKGLETYIMKLMSEYYASVPQEPYTNPDLERGIELEEQAIGMYELEKKCDVEKVGFIEIDKFSGCSPDGLIGKEGGLEVKAHNNLNHFKILLNGEKEIESKYIWQIQMNLLMTGRKWWDYVSYNPNYKDNLLIFRIEPDKEKFEKLEEGLKVGKEKIKEIIKNYEKRI
jgi:exodeoxyribonuclease (lambda-induced)